MRNQRTVEHVEATRAARKAFADALAAYYPKDPVRATMMGYAEAFSDMIVACSESRSAAELINLANSWLWPAGYQITPLLPPARKA